MKHLGTLVTIIIGIMMFFLASCNTASRTITVKSIMYGTQHVQVDFTTTPGQTIRVCGDEGIAYAPTDMIQHIGHIAVVQ
jgi:hypothetical protein